MTHGKWREQDSIVSQSIQKEVKGLLDPRLGVRGGRPRGEGGAGGGADGCGVPSES